MGDRPAHIPGLLAGTLDTRGYPDDAVLVRGEKTLGHIHQGRRVGDIPDPAPGVDAAQKQDLGLEDVPDPGQVPLVEEGFPDRPVGGGTQPADRLFRVPIGPEQVRAEVASHPILLRGTEHLDHAQLVADRLPGVVREHQPDPVAGRDAVAGGTDTPRAVHAEVCVHGETPSTRSSRCLPRDRDSVTERPVRSVVANRGTRKSLRVSTRPASASRSRLAASQTTSPSGTRRAQAGQPAS